VTAPVLELTEPVLAPIVARAFQDGTADREWESGREDANARILAALTTGHID
jgi:hypothetical protein